MIQQAFVAGLLAASTLLFGSVIVVMRPVKSRTIGLVMAFGSGALISSVAYELIAEAYRTVPGEPTVLAAFFVGAFIFYVGDVLIERIGGGKRKSARGEQSGAALGILLGSVLDGIPESFVLGISLIGGGTVSLAYFAGGGLLQLSGRVIKHCWPSEGRIWTEVGSNAVGPHRGNLSGLCGARLYPLYGCTASGRRSAAYICGRRYYYNAC
ncbi:MAG: ZIP family metal transporter [Halobacteriota archaeon]